MAEKVGHKTINDPMRNQNIENQWQIIKGPKKT